jgi:DNA-binding MarR family transcriptional regulator
VLPEDPIAEARRQWISHGWADAATGMAAVTSLMRAQAIVQARVDEVLRPLGLTFARFELLQLLDFSRRESMSMTRAGALLQVHPASVTNAASRLETAGLIARSVDPEDRRGVLMSITDAGRSLAGVAADHLNTKVFADVGLETPQLESLIGLIAELRHAAGDYA